MTEPVTPTAMDTRSAPGCGAEVMKSEFRGERLRLTIGKSWPSTGLAHGSYTPRVPAGGWDSWRTGAKLGGRVCLSAVTGMAGVPDE